MLAGCDNRLTRTTPGTPEIIINTLFIGCASEASDILLIRYNENISKWRYVLKE